MFRHGWQQLPGLLRRCPLITRGIPPPPEISAPTFSTVRNPPREEFYRNLAVFLREDAFARPISCRHEGEDKFERRRPCRGCCPPRCTRYSVSRFRRRLPGPGPCPCHALSWERKARKGASGLPGAFLCPCQ